MRLRTGIICLCCWAVPLMACAGEQLNTALLRAGDSNSDPLGLRLVRICRERFVQPLAQQIRHELQRHYSAEQLERLLASGDAETRRAAALAIGVIGNANCATAVATALHDPDPGVCRQAETASWQIWARLGSSEDQLRLLKIKDAIRAEELQDAVTQVSLLIQTSPDYAEAWNQRALAYYQMNRYRDAIPDCRRALELNPYHFGASSGLAQCHLRLNELPEAMDALQLTAKLHPSMPGLQEQISVLEGRMKK